MKKGFILLGLLTILVATCCFVACNKDCVHEIVVDKGIEATCTTSGLTEGKHCSICEEILLEQIAIPATGHTSCEAVYENVCEATCTNDGSCDKVIYCSICNIEISRTNVSLLATGHQLVPYDSKAPSCTDVGWNTYMECEKCDYTTKVEIPAQHTPAEAVVENKIEATCLENGSFDSVVYCSKCNVEVSRETKTVPATGHTLESYPSQEPTCTENGWGAYEACKNCDYTTKVEIPSQHSPSESMAENVVQATCNEKGSYDNVIYCLACNENLFRETIETPALGHTQGEAVIENMISSTCTILGSFDNVVYCSACTEELSRTKEKIEALGHDLQEFDAVEPTCTEKGWSAGQACTRCNATLREEIPAKGHDKIHHDGQAPTCTESGWKAYDTCSRCDYTTYKELAAAHVINYYNAKYSTCTSIGWKDYEACENCDYTTYEEIPPAGHRLINYSAKAPSCSYVGWNAYERCSRCNYTTYEELPKTDHNYDLTNDIFPQNANIGRCLDCGFHEFTFKYDRAAYDSVMLGKQQLILTGLGKDFKGTHVVIPEKLGNRSVDAIDNSTFKNANTILDVIREIPLKYLLVETDAPYLTPEPHRGKPNEPKYTIYMANKIAEIKGLGVSEVIEETNKNAKRIFTRIKN